MASVTGPSIVWAPGRVNLIGEHTDYTGGFVLPMAIDLGITITSTSTIASVEADDDADRMLDLTSSIEAERFRCDLPVLDAASVQPPWGRYPAGVAAELGSTRGLTGSITSTLPAGAGLSSSAALEVATALALGFDGSPVETARVCRAAEERATGVPCGIMDQLASAGGVEGHALLIDCRTETTTPIPIPPDVEIVVIHSGQARTLVGSAYAERRAQCERAEVLIGPLRDAAPEAWRGIEDPLVSRRARHVLSENRRVLEFVAALSADDLVGAGRLMVESHRSLRDEFEVSTDQLDALVGRLLTTPGVHGARLTGAGFGGCVVALAEPGALSEGWIVRPSAGARRLT